MLTPKPRGTPIDAARYDEWLARFSAYFDTVTRQLIEHWLDQFAAADKDLAARVLDAVKFVGTSHIDVTMRNLLNSMQGWSLNPALRSGRWFFVPFSGSAGESGDAMVHRFRMANGLSRRQFNHLFPHRAELVSLKLSHNDTVVLIDDFAGTGKQACDSWKEFFAELLADGPRVVLLLVGATSNAIDRIRDNTGMHPMCGDILGPRHSIVDGACTYFTAQEKATVRQYCKRADAKNPDGFGGCGLLYVLAHRCPNNSLPILHARHDRWRGLFPRHG